MRATVIASIVLSILVCESGGSVAAEVLFSGDQKRNNLVSELLEAAAISNANNSFTFTRSGEGWIFISASCQGKGTATLVLDDATKGGVIRVDKPDSGAPTEAVRFVSKGEHKLRVECEGDARVDKL